MSGMLRCGAMAVAISGAALGAPILEDFEGFDLGSSAQNGWTDSVFSSIVDSGFGGFDDRSLRLEGSAMFSLAARSPSFFCSCSWEAAENTPSLRSTSR